ncbi:MAG TPA: NAD(P)-binding domain-containing protein [Bryobacteraceae bacterium]|nr:NAD(P)-binding domain-containing protein [Bryobacteraceae bacterium]
MRVGILGSGTVGQVLGAGFIKHGHQAMIGTRDPKKEEVAAWVRETPGAKSGTFEEAARFGDLIVLAALGRAVGSIIDLAGPGNLVGKTVIDATNPLADEPPVKGVLRYTTGPNESLGEWVQAKLPAARVVKAFNSVGNALMINPKFSQGTPTMFFCGDSEEAKSVVAAVIRQFGWEPYDCGGIVAARVRNRCACCGACRDSCETTGGMRSKC